MSDYPRYFAFGDKYVAPNPYYRVDDETHSALVIPDRPTDQELTLDRRLEFFVSSADRGMLTETTRQKINAAIGRWLGQFFPRE